MARKPRKTLLSFSYDNREAEQNGCYDKGETEDVFIIVTTWNWNDSQWQIVLLDFHGGLHYKRMVASISR